MHPIVIMAYDKSPAIGGAVGTLQEAGYEVRVLNTNTAKLVDFLGALAGADEDDPPKKEEEEPKEEPKEETDELPPEDDELPPGEAPVEEAIAFLDGEEVKAIIVEGDGLTFHPEHSQQKGEKITFQLNESTVSFWSNDSNTHLFSVGLDDVQVTAPVVIGEKKSNKLEIGKDWLAKRGIAEAKIHPNISSGAVVLNAANHPLTLEGKRFSLDGGCTVFGTVAIAEQAVKDHGDSKMRVAKCTVSYGASD